ncbi:metal ABC transporter permease [Candidatus Gracilibacteria bacterium]|nr:metal ABC transporter permease [Candidatus Gracilibacteria bacterium]NUJ98400.1 metal ABC transporter permease [Candidatus Gracilibacteria bacterium]
MLEILHYPFFQNAIIGGILISLIASILGILVVMRKEANVTHSISNFLFLGIAVSLLFNGNYYLYSFLFGIIGSFLIFFIEKTRFITKESTKEIISQAGIAGGIFTIGFLGNLSLDINNFLFGSILFINRSDLILLSILLLILYLCFYFFGKRFLSVIINQDIAKTRGIKVDIYNLVFLIFLSIFISVSIKIFGILLIGAFLVIPANISKIISPSLKLSFVISSLISILGVVLGLFISYFLNTSSGATIVLILILFFMFSIFWAKKGKT